MFAALMAAQRVTKSVFYTLPLTAKSSDILFIQVCYRLMAVAVKAMHTTSTHNILLESLLSDV